MILETIDRLSKVSGDYVEDLEISRTTQIDINQVRDAIEILHGEGCVDVVRTTTGFTVAVNAKGRLTIGQFASFQDGGNQQSQSAIQELEAQTNPADPSAEPAGRTPEPGHWTDMGEDADVPPLPPPPISRRSRFSSASVQSLPSNAAQNNAPGKQRRPQSRQAPRGSPEISVQENRHLTKGEIAVAHLSDLHFGYGKLKHAERAWSLLEEILREVKPSLLLISGDLVDTPRRKYFDQAIQKLQGLDVPYYACLGNHDWHRKGTRLDPRLTFGRVWFRTACTVLWLLTAVASYHGIGRWALGFVALAATPWVGPWVICRLWNSVGTNLFDAGFAKRILGPKPAKLSITPIMATRSGRSACSASIRASKQTFPIEASSTRCTLHRSRKRPKSKIGTFASA
jgi:hypothetical protein